MLCVNTIFEKYYKAVSYGHLGLSPARTLWRWSGMHLRIVHPEEDEREHLFTRSWSPVVKDWPLATDLLPPFQVHIWVSAQQVRETVGQSVRDSWWSWDTVVLQVTPGCCKNSELKGGHGVLASAAHILKLEQKGGQGDVRWSMRCVQHTLSLKYYRRSLTEVESRWEVMRNREEVWWILVTPWSSLEHQGVIVPPPLFKVMISNCLSPT